MSGNTLQSAPDQAARRRAVTDFETNLVVLAGAGSGKTSLMIERILNLVGSGRCGVDRLAAITFTEKAAGELRERLAVGFDRLRALTAEEQSPDPTHAADRAFQFLVTECNIDREELSQRALEAMRQLGSATVSTIHALCSEILRRHPLEAGVDPDFAVDTGEHAEQLRQEIWESFLARELGPEAPRPELWQRLLEQGGLREAATVGQALADFGVPSELLTPPFAIDPLPLLTADAQTLIADIEDLLGRQQGMTDLTEQFFSQLLEALRLFCSHGLEAFQIQVSGSPLAPRLDQSTRWPHPTKSLAGVTPLEMRALSKRCGQFGSKLLRIDEAHVSTVLEAVAPYVHEFREALLRRALVSFDGLLLLTRDLLRDHPAVRRSLKQRYPVLLIDEFQDTDPVQHEIAMFLAEAADGEASAAFETRLAPGRLFVVGDAKQSIYRFRGADYAAYRRSIQHIRDSGGVELSLESNFRSVPGLVEPMNQLFQDPSGCWAESDYQPQYVPIQAVREAMATTAPAVELWTIDLPPEAKAEDRREAEGRAIASWIHERVAAGDCRYREITILFRAFTNISHYLRPLREQGVPFVVDGGRDFLRRPEVHQLVAALRTLSQPADQPALLAFLRSPAGGVSDQALADYATAGGRWDWRRSIDGSLFPDIARCFKQLRELAARTLHLPADAVVRHVVEATHQLALGAAAYEGTQRVANLRKLAAAAGELARDGRLSLEQVIEAVREGRLADIETDRPLSDDAAEAVRITSIHRMKGLENDWVFLPDLARQEPYARMDRRPVCLGRDRQGQPQLAIQLGRIHNAARVQYDIDHERHEAAEEVRVLYVALTRARERLVVVAGPAKGKTPWIDALAPWGYQPEEPPDLGASLAAGQVLHRRQRPEPVVQLVPAVTPEWASRAVVAYGEALQRVRQMGTTLATPSATHGDEAPLGQAAAAKRRHGKALGIVLHRLLERWAGGHPSDLTPQLAPLCRDVARAEGLSASELQAEVDEVWAAFLASTLADDLSRIEPVAREVPILLRRDQQIFRGNIDLLYRDGAQWVVADYKTDRDDDEPAMRQRYGEQLRIYGAAVGQALGLQTAPRGELWLLRHGKRLVVDIPS